MKTGTLITVTLWLGVLKILFAFLATSEGFLIAGAILFAGGVIAKAIDAPKLE